MTNNEKKPRRKPITFSVDEAEEINEFISDTFLTKSTAIKSMALAFLHLCEKYPDLKPLMLMPKATDMVVADIIFKVGDDSKLDLNESINNCVRVR